MSKLHRYRIPRRPHDARTAIFRWSPDFLTSDGDQQVPRQSPLDDLLIAVGASAEISVILKVNRAATEQSPGGGRQTSGAWLLRPGSRSKKSGDDLPMPQDRNRQKIGGSPHDSKSLWRSYYLGIIETHSNENPTVCPVSPGFKLMTSCIWYSNPT